LGSKVRLLIPEEDKIFPATLRAVRYAYRLIHEKAAAQGTATDHPSLQQSEEAAYYLV
jgi:hypothetical protein